MHAHIAAPSLLKMKTRSGMGKLAPSPTPRPNSAAAWLCAAHEWPPQFGGAAQREESSSDRLETAASTRAPPPPPPQRRRRRTRAGGHWQQEFGVSAVAAAALLLVTPQVLGEVVPRDFSPTVLCSAERFAKAYDSLVEPTQGLFEGWSDKEAVVKRYKELTEINSCERVPSPRWPMSFNRTKPLIINAGEGSTATRFLNCVMRRIGNYGAHTRGGPNQEKQNSSEFMGCDYYSSCTDGWDLFNYISDSPVAYQLTQLLATHPNSLVLHSLRDPASWKKSRISKHLHQGAAKWHQAAPCGMSDHPMDHPQTELDFVVYNAWAKCVSPVGKRYLQINLFKQETVQVVLQILFFVHAHNLTIKPRIIGGMANITTYKHLAGALEDTCREEAFLAKLRNGTAPKASSSSTLNGGRRAGAAPPTLPKRGKRKDDGIADIATDAKRSMCQPQPSGAAGREVAVRGDSCKTVLPKVGLGRGRNLIDDSYNDPTLDVESCCQKCNSLPNCVGWSINSLLKGCFLKREVPDTKWWAYGTDATVVSGIKAAQTLVAGDASHTAWCAPLPTGSTVHASSTTSEDAADRAVNAWSDLKVGLGIAA